MGLPRWSAVQPRWRAALALAMVFVAGVAGGALIEDLADAVEDAVFTADHDDDDESEEAILKKLDLTASQREGVARALQAREARLEVYWDAQLPRMELLLDSSRNTIRTLLTPSQREAYDTYISRLRLNPRHELEEHDDD